MSSKRRIRRRSCSRKQRHSTEGAAWATAKNAAKRGLGDMRAYKCQFCGGYHIGH